MFLVAPECAQYTILAPINHEEDFEHMLVLSVVASAFGSRAESQISGSGDHSGTSVELSQDFRILHRDS